MEAEEENNKKNEVIIGAKPIPLDIIDQIKKAICKIIIIEKEENHCGTGFFWKYSDSKKFLITCYHVINPTLKNEKIEIEIFNKNKMKLNLSGRFVKYFIKPKDITIIEIKESDEIYKDIEYLDYDLNFMKNGYSHYKGADIFSIHYPKGGKAKCSSGKIIDLYNDNELYHDISTDDGSSGCPIMLLNDNINFIRVIGIHKYGIKNEKKNGGTFIGEILYKEIICNFIISEMHIKYEDLDKNIRLINSGNDKEKLLNNGNLNNEETIEKCEIMVNNVKIPFSYFYKFKSKGTYKVEYRFQKNLKNLSFIFRDCEYITNINLSNFNTENVTNMEGMFSGCSSLTNVDLSKNSTKKVTNMRYMFENCVSLQNADLSNFNTENVNDFECMFYQCSSLTNINLSNFNTKNVNDMSGMFSGCSSLTNINLSNFNTENVTNISAMFYGCSSLKNVVLSNFNTENVTNMKCMFYGCSSLTEINLSNFKTQNVNDMEGMFGECSSLTNINLSNFNTENVNFMRGMFYKCGKLKKDEIISKDERILKDEELFKQHNYTIIKKNNKTYKF